MHVSKINHRMLGTLCERVGVAFEVGLDPHRVFDREAKGGKTTYGKRMSSVAEHVRKGGSLGDAVKAQGGYFPSHFAEMIEAGEQTGKLDRVLERLSEYYNELAEFKSIFLNSILWPFIQLVIGILVVALLIYLPSVLIPGKEVDLLGFGLVGYDGLMTYTMIISSVAFAILVLWVLAKNGYFNFMADIGARLPLVGKTFAIFPEARFVQTLSLAIEAGMDAWTAIELSFNSAGTPRFASKASAAKDAILQGQDMHRVLADTGLFQEETLETVELGEDSGRLSETLDKHFKYLKAQVKTSMAKLTYIASGIIWFVVAALLVTIIFRVFSLYVGNIGDAAESAIKKTVQD